MVGQCFPPDPSHEVPRLMRGTSLPGTGKTSLLHPTHTLSGFMFPPQAELCSRQHFGGKGHGQDEHPPVCDRGDVEREEHGAGGAAAAAPDCRPGSCQTSALFIPL